MTTETMAAIERTDADGYEPELYLLADMERARQGIADGIARLDIQRAEMCSRHTAALAEIDARIGALRAALETPAEKAKTRSSASNQLSDRIAGILAGFVDNTAAMATVAKRLGHKRVGGICGVIRRDPGRFTVRKIGRSSYIALRAS